MPELNELGHLLQTFAHKGGTISIKQILEDLKLEMGLGALVLSNRDSQIKEVFQTDVNNLNSHLSRIFGIKEEAIVYDSTRDCYQILIKTSLAEGVNLAVSYQNYLLHLKSKILNPQSN